MHWRVPTVAIVLAAFFALSTAPRAIGQAQSGNPPQTATPPQQSQQPGQPATPPIILRVGGDVLTKNLVKMVPPVYPQFAKMAQVQGTVVLHVIIAEDGTVKDVKVVSGSPLLIAAAVDAVKQWRYQPTLLNGKPVLVDSQVSVIFTLHHEAGSDEPPPSGEHVVVPSTPEAPPPAIDPQLKADILQLLDAVNFENLCESMGRAAMDSKRSVIDAALPPTPHREQIVDAFEDDVMSIFRSDELRDRFIAIYAKHFSDDDIKGMTQFFRSPVGQHYIAASAELYTEGSEVGGSIALEKIPGILQDLCTKFPELQGQAKFCKGSDKKSSSELLEGIPALQSKTTTVGP